MDRNDLQNTFGTGAFTRMLTPAFARMTWLITLALGGLWILASILYTAAAWGGTGTAKAAELFGLFRSVALAVVVVMLIRAFLEIALMVAERNRAQ